MCTLIWSNSTKQGTYCMNTRIIYLNTPNMFWCIDHLQGCQ
jgi:hypothetical protein